MRALITGGRGFLGTALWHEIAERFNGAWELLVLPPYPVCDICDWETVEEMQAFEPNIVFHLAAVHFVPWCREHPRETMATNVQGSVNVIESTRSAYSFVFASSAAVYGFHPTLLTEAHPVNPVDVYGQSKAMVEAFLAQDFRRRCVAARLFNLVGPNDPVPHLMPLILGAKGGSVKLDMGGLQWARDYVHVEDAARSLLDLALGSPMGLTRVNVSTGIATTGWDLAKWRGLNVIDNPAARREGGGHLFGSNDKLLALTGRVPTEPFTRLEDA